MEQRYKSDCDCCKFVRQGKDYLDNDCDIFVTTSSEKCIVFRYSDRPSDNRAIGLERFNSTNFYKFEGMEEVLSMF